MQLVFKNKTKLGSDFPFRDWISKDLISVSFVSFTVVSKSPIMVNALYT